MESVNQKVWRVMRSDPAILKDLRRRLLNMRSLAKYLIKTYEIKASLDAVISSIRRFPMDELGEDERIYNEIFRDSVVSTMNNISCVTIRLPADEVISRLNAFDCPGMRMATGTNKVKILVKSKYVPKLLEMFKKAIVDNDLSEIAVTVSEQAIKTKGVMARIANEIALANINIQELIVCPPQFFIYVLEKDIVRAHERVLSLTA